MSYNIKEVLSTSGFKSTLGSNLILDSNVANDLGDIIFTYNDVEKHRIYDIGIASDTLWYRKDAGTSYPLIHGGNFVNYGVPYNGANQSVNLNNQNLTNVNTLTAKTLNSNHTAYTIANTGIYQNILSLDNVVMYRYQHQYWNGSAMTGSQSYGLGNLAIEYNRGDYGLGIGHAALQNNQGTSVLGIGRDTLRYNLGGNTNGAGHAVGQYNVGAGVNLFGWISGQFNTGDYASGFGHNVLRYNDGNNNTVVGGNSFNNFAPDTSKTKTFDSTAINVANKTITIPSHGFGSAGQYRNLQFVQGTSAITGLLNGTINQFKIIDANTIAWSETLISGQIRQSVNITDAGTGTGHQIRTQLIYSNVSILGYDLEPTKSNQTIFSGGEALLPQSTVATIDADSTNKSLITKEWYNSKQTANNALYIPYTGANQNANLGIYGITANGIKVGHSSTATFNSFNSSLAFAFLNGSNAQQILTGGTLASNSYSDISKLPVNGIYSKGLIRTEGIFSQGANNRVFNKVFQVNLTSSFTGIVSLVFPNPSASATVFDMTVNVYGYQNKYLGRLRFSFYKISATEIHPSGNIGLLDITDNFPSTKITANIDASNNLRINFGEATTLWSSNITFEIERIETKLVGAALDWGTGWYFEQLTSEPTGYINTKLLDTKISATRDWVENTANIFRAGNLRANIVETVTNLDSALPFGGFIASYNSSAWGGSDRPSGASYGGYLKFRGYTSDINNLDFYYNNGNGGTAGRLWFRTKNGSGLTSWKELLHTENIESLIITDSPFTGVQDGVNKVFTLPTAYKSGSTRVYLNGQRLKKGSGNDYTESSTTQITFEDAPKATDVIIIDYVK